MKHILLAEDDPFIVDVYTRSFAREGFSVDVANDGQMALDKVHSHHPDLLALDIDLPKVNGCEVLKRLRENPATKNIKVIVLSNYGDKDINQKYNVDIGSFDIIAHFLKIETPVEEIVKMVKEILK